MHKLTADNQKRVRIPDAKPGQVFAYEATGKGQFKLTLVKPVEPEYRPIKAKLVEDKDGFTVVVPGQPINEEAIKELLAEFPCSHEVFARR